MKDIFSQMERWQLQRIMKNSQKLELFATTAVELLSDKNLNLSEEDKLALLLLHFLSSFSKQHLLSAPRP